MNIEYIDVLLKLTALAMAFMAGFQLRGEADE